MSEKGRGGYFTALSSPSRKGIAKRKPSKQNRKRRATGADEKRQQEQGRLGGDDHDTAFTDTDSFCGDKLHRNEFRVYEVNNGEWTTSCNVTQYWVADEEGFKHFVLADKDRQLWASLNIDFNVKFHDILAIRSNKNSLYVQLRLKGASDGKPRDDMMVSFKRFTTHARFIKYCKGWDIRMISGDKDEMESLWDVLKSEVMYDGADEGK